MPSEFGALTSLILLGLENTDITSLPTEIGMLTALTLLYMTDSELTSLVSGPAAAAQPQTPPARRPAGPRSTCSISGVRGTDWRTRAKAVGDRGVNGPEQVSAREGGIVCGQRTDTRLTRVAACDSKITTS